MHPNCTFFLGLHNLAMLRRTAPSQGAPLLPSYAPTLYFFLISTISLSRAISPSME